MVQMSLQNSAGKVFFYGLVPRNPFLDTIGSESTLVTFKWHLKMLREESLLTTS